MSVQASSIGSQVERKVLAHILPWTMLGMVIAYIDRMNISIAQLQMSKELGLSAAAYGLGAGLFFIGYFLFEIPSNMVMERVGARVWLSRIMITWGIISSLMFLARTEPVFYLLRFLLGVAEAGFFPGLLLYVTYWTTEKNRAMSSGAFLAGGQIGILIGYPVSGLILDTMHNVMGISGWQWLFILEGIPAFILGILWLVSEMPPPRSSGWTRKKRIGSSKPRQKNTPRRKWSRRRKSMASPPSPIRPCGSLPSSTSSACWPPTAWVSGRRGPSSWPPRAPARWWLGCSAWEHPWRPSSA
jgi:MFS family permease